MSSSQPPPAMHREYRMKWQKQFIYLTAGLAILAIALFVDERLIPFDRHIGRALASLIRVIFSYVGTIVLLRAFPGRLIIDGTRIEIRRRFRRRSADQSEIEGKYSTNSEYGSITVLRLYDKRKIISIPKSIELDENFSSWLKQLPDLDKNS